MGDLKTVRRLFSEVGAGASDVAELLAAATACQKHSPDPESAEAARLAMLGLAVVGRHDEAEVWRARALIGAAACGWRSGVGALTVSLAMRLLARENQDYAAGSRLDQIHGCARAREILDAIWPLVEGDDNPPVGGPDQRTLRRFLQEKGGFLALLDGDFDAAASLYAQAVDQAHDQRGRVKSQLGGALVAYLRALDEGSETTSAISDTESLILELDGSSLADLRTSAKANATLMREGSRALVAYEIL